MIEQKLQQAANTLPEPTCDYLSVEEAYKQRQSSPKPQIKRRRLIAIICLALLLAGCVAGPTVPEYHLYNGSLSLLFPRMAMDDVADLLGTDPEWRSAKKEAASHGWTIPESLGGSPWYEIGKANLTTKKSNWFMAMLFHHYTQYSVSYGYEMETEITQEDGSPSTACWTDKDVTLHFGSIENEVWRRQFGFDEADIWVAPEGTLVTDSFVYEGLTLYVSTYPLNSDFFGLLSKYLQRVYWVDYENNTVFGLSAQDDTPDFIISCAKELIDQLH